MPIRLIKVSKNLNVGINSLVEFLHKKGIEIEANPNAKIEDEQYDILIAEFGKDKNIRREATETREKLHRRDEKRETVAIEGYELPEESSKKKVEKDFIEPEIPRELKPRFNIVGTIDLDNLNKKKSDPKLEETVKEVAQDAPIAPEPQIVPETAIVPESEIVPEPSIEKEPIDTTPSPQSSQTHEISPEPVSEKESPFVKEDESTVIPLKEKEVSSAPTSVDEKLTMSQIDSEITKTEDRTPIDNIETTPASEEINEDKPEEIIERTDESTSDNVFRLNVNKIESNIVVKGSIDLNAINDRTRPPRKSRAQRKRTSGTRAESH